MASRFQHGKQRFQPAPPEEMNLFDGLLLVDKPAGPTSHDIVDEIRRRFSIRKAGHGGTLDPQATGLLILLIGRGTKQSRYFISCDKTYEGVMRLGISTDTQDREGRILRESAVDGIIEDRVKEELAKRTGDQMQIPPMVSAVKVNGTALYKKARKGEEVERKSRLIHVYEFKMRYFELPRVEFTLKCSKGTYVRTLCSDIGDALGCGAHLEELRRTECGEFSVSESIAFEDLIGMTRDELAEKVVPLNRISTIQGPARQPGL